MYNRQETLNNINYVRIDKRRARGLYNKGIELVLVPSNMRVFSTMWGIEYFANMGKSGDFDKLCNSYKFYNCVSCETGYNISFYVKEEDAQ